MDGNDGRGDVSGMVKATAACETWLGSQVPLWRDDLAYKHEPMAEGRGMITVEKVQLVAESERQA